MKPAVKIFFAIFCFGAGIAFGANALTEFKNEHGSNPEIPAAISGMFLLGAFLLLRRAPPAR